MHGHPSYFANLTEEQQEEIDSLRETMIKDNATADEIMDAVNEKLRELGIDIPTRDEMLETEIERTTLHLEILNRQKELRELGYSWDEIHDLITDEYGIDIPLESHNHEFHGTHGMGEFDPAFIDTANTNV